MYREALCHPDDLYLRKPETDGGRVVEAGGAVLAGGSWRGGRGHHLYGRHCPPSRPPEIQRLYGAALVQPSLLGLMTHITQEA